MIQDLSQVLKRIIEDSAASAPEQLSALAQALVSFERPAESFTPAQTTINLFLHDLREAVELRNPEPVFERLDGRVVVRQPPSRLACTYLVTAWPVGDVETVLQEHRLLSQVFQVFSAYPTVPVHFLNGSQLAGQEPSIPLTLRRGDDLKDPSEFWTAVGNKLRPSLSLTAVLSVPPFESEPPSSFPVVTTKVLRLAPQASPERPEDWFQIRGRVLRQDGGGDAVPVPAASVRIAERGDRAQTNAAGEFTFTGLSPGPYTLRAEAVDPETQRVATGAIAINLSAAAPDPNAPPTLTRYDVLLR